MRRIAIVAVVLACFGACSGEAGTADTITVGAVTFAENQIVAEMYAQVLEDAGFEVERRFNFPDRESLLPELESGAVDLAPEYLASLLTALDPEAEPSSKPDENISELGPLLDENGLQVLEAAEANDTNSIVVAKPTAARLDLASVSDLQPHAKHLVFGGPPECPERQFCLAGLREVYGLDFKEFKVLDAGGSLTVAALTSGEIDVGLMFSTSGIIADRGFVVLEDDKGLQAADNITPVIRDEALTGEVEQLLARVGEVLTTETMTELNAMVEVEGKDFRDVATVFLEAEGLLGE